MFKKLRTENDRLIHSHPIFDDECHHINDIKIIGGNTHIHLQHTVPEGKESFFCTDP